MKNKEKELMRELSKMPSFMDYFGQAKEKGRKATRIADKITSPIGRTIAATGKGIYGFAKEEHEKETFKKVGMSVGSYFNTLNSHARHSEHIGLNEPMYRLRNPYAKPSPKPVIKHHRKKHHKAKYKTIRVRI